MTRKPTQLDAIADSWVEKMAELSPSFATYIGRKGFDDQLDDYSPEAQEAHLAESKKFFQQVKDAPVADKVDEVTKDAMMEDFQLGIELHESGLWKRDLNVIASPAQSIRDIFDLSPTDGEEAWTNLVKRMNAVPETIDGYIRSLRLGIDAGDTPARRQVIMNIEQAEGIAAADGFFIKFAEGAKVDGALKSEVEQAGRHATEGYAKLAEFFKNELLPKANEVDAIGRERYALNSRRFLGARIDLDETYEWGIEELARVTAEQNAVANEIKTGASVQEAIEVLNNDASRKLHSTEELQRWMQNLSDTAIEKLNGVHFDIAEPLRKLECMIAPTNSGAIYYTGPTDDFSRPGRMWWSVPEGVTEFDTWRETTTVYHEGVPGHHLQIAQQVYNRDELNSWRRLASWSSGHGEGWALYAERLMADLGFLDDPGDRLGMLDGQRMRAARVVLDLGVHLGKKKLDGSGVWDFEYALDFMGKNVNMSKEFVNFEVHRYFGWPGQAPSYKIGQRIWEQIRDEYQAKQGNSFDIKEFHRTALNLGGLGLDVLKRAVLG
jgi:uncharacterized protein (DUF885 family)